MSSPILNPAAVSAPAIPVPPATIYSVSQIIYVDPLGNDGTALRGPVNRPFLTFAAALSAAQDGDTIMVRRGTYTLPTFGHVINVANLTIKGETGAKFVPASQTDTDAFRITASGVTVEGLEFDMLWTNAAASVEGVVEIENASNVTVRNTYIHHSRGIGVRAFGTNYSGLTVRDCRITHCDIGVVTMLQFNTDQAEVAVRGTRISNCRNGGIRQSSLSGTGRYVGLQLVANSIRDCGPDGLGIELFGQHPIGGIKPSFYSAIVSNNYVGGAAATTNAFGISISSVENSVVSNNTVLAGSALGIEVAYSVGSTISDNTITGKDAAGVQTAGDGYGISNQGGSSGVINNIEISGGSVRDIGRYGIILFSKNKLSIRDIDVQSSDRALLVQFSNNIEISDCKFESANSYAINIQTSSRVKIDNVKTKSQTAAAQMSQSDTVEISNSHLELTAGGGIAVESVTGGGEARNGAIFRDNYILAPVGANRVYQFWGSGGSGTFSGVHISGTRTNLPNTGAAFVGTTTATLDAPAIYDNLPYHASDATLGFQNSSHIGAAIGSTLKLNAVPVYANNAAALAGGLPVGATYRTGGDPDVLAIVH